MTIADEFGVDGSVGLRHILFWASKNYSCAHRNSWSRLPKLMIPNITNHDAVALPVIGQEVVVARSERRPLEWRKFVTYFT